MPDLLIELFSEEIPARMQLRAGEDLKKHVTDRLVAAGLTYASAAAFTTPRRLTLTVEGLLDQSPTLKEERKGPRVDAPEKAIEGFLRGVGLTRQDLEIRDEKKGQVYYATITRNGQPAADIVAQVLEETIRNFPWPKAMRWGTSPLRWVRPLHSILCILSSDAGHQIVPLSIEGISAGATTRGHRFMSPDEFEVIGFDDYVSKLKRAHVVLDPKERADAIWQDATNQAFANGLEVVEDTALLNEVAGLVEWPVVLMGKIDDEFLELPAEVLQTSMREHQKFFSVKNPKSNRIERFITVANRETSDQGATVLAGNQKVLSARLYDAKFFWDNDIRLATSTGLNTWVNRLSDVTFHNKLGSQKARIERFSKLAKLLAPFVGADSGLVVQAADVVKADLSSEMVFEFPELQGLMGRYYAQQVGLPDAVANACEEHYSPLGPTDGVPSAPVSIAVAMADKLDMLLGFWVIEEKPTGSKDPFALRRAALGVIRLILENNIRLSLGEVLQEQLKVYQDISIENDNVVSDLLGFVIDRLKVYMRDQGIRHDVIDACLSIEQSDDLALLVKRAQALQGFITSSAGENLLQGFKRANNILTQAETKDGVEYSFGADINFAKTDEEKNLFSSLTQMGPVIDAATKGEDFEKVMKTLASLRDPIDRFFETVQINDDNDIIRRNRLNILGQIRQIGLSVADLTRIEG